MHRRILLVAVGLATLGMTAFLRFGHTSGSDRGTGSRGNADALKAATRESRAPKIAKTSTGLRPVQPVHTVTRQAVSSAYHPPDSAPNRDPWDPPDALANVVAAMEELRPLINECYELGRVEFPGLTDVTAIIDLNIVSDRDRAVVVRSELGEGTDTLPTAFKECLLETMYRLPLAPPQRPESAVIALPLHFSLNGVRTVSDLAGL